MHVKHFLVGVLLAIALVQPASAMCLGDVLQAYLAKSPDTNRILLHSGCELALVKIVAVHRDPKSKRPIWCKDSGTLTLSTLESTGKQLPTNFSVRFQKRKGEGYDCETWDFVVLKPGEHLLGFFYLENKKWSVPDTAAYDVINNVQRIDSDLRAKAQHLFRTRLFP